MSVLDDVLDDLTAEGDQLESWVTPLSDEQWRTPTPAAGWDVATTIAHLAWTDEVVVVAATDPTGWEQLILEAMGDPEGFVDATAAAAATAPAADLLDRWRTARRRLPEVLRAHPEGEKVPWFGPPMSPASMATARFMETWAHGLDVADALGVTAEPTDRIRHVAHLGVRTRDFAYATHSLEPPAEAFRVELRAPSGEIWTWGPDDAVQSVTGPAYDFCLLVAHRRHRDDLDLVATGADADRWLDIAQAFAGPPGTGRTPTSGAT